MLAEADRKQNEAVQQLKGSKADANRQKIRAQSRWNVFVQRTDDAGDKVSAVAVRLYFLALARIQRQFDHREISHLLDLRHPQFAVDAKAGGQAGHEEEGRPADRVVQNAV